MKMTKCMLHASALVLSIGVLAARPMPGVAQVSPAPTVPPQISPMVQARRTLAEGGSTDGDL